MTTTETTLVPFGVEHVRAVCAGPILPNEIPESDLIFGFRLNALDLTSSNGYRWPFPGNWAEASGPFIPGPDAHGDACPHHKGDGLCIAKTIAGAQSAHGAFGRSLGLLVAYLADDLLHASDDKIRVRRAWVADLFDPVRALARANLARANLDGANLARANLDGANLARANLDGANLARANLDGASLARASLARANLAGANLDGANLARANLDGASLARASLARASLARANLSGANLARANLDGASLARASLARANLSGANLARANLDGASLARASLARASLARANLSGATYSQQTLWPTGVDPAARGAIKVD